jgi:hypothetical protein
LFLITLCRMAKSDDIFWLTSLCHIAIKVEGYRTQNRLMQCLQVPAVRPRLGEL